MDRTFERFAGRLAVGLSLAFGLALPAAAQTLYKLIDKNGKITYSEEAPKNFNGQVIRIEVDPNRNTATLPKYEPAAKAPPAERGPKEGEGKKNSGEKKLSPEQQLQEAKDRVEKARLALADARDNPRPGEIEFIGRVTGGARPQPTEAYQLRLAGLEKALKSAEDDVQTLERGR